MNVQGSGCEREERKGGSRHGGWRGFLEGESCGAEQDVCSARCGVAYFAWTVSSFSLCHDVCMNAQQYARINAS